jgi:hypothetical protein
MPRVISEEDCQQLKELHHRAMSTPVIATSVAEGLAGNDWASQAWRRVARFQETLGQKYGFDHLANAINADTGELVPLPQEGKEASE